MIVLHASSNLHHVLFRHSAFLILYPAIEALKQQLPQAVKNSADGSLPLHFLVVFIKMVNHGQHNKQVCGDRRQYRTNVNPPLMQML
jgi:hypothetical protein